MVISGDHGAPGFPHGKCNLYSFGTGVCLSVTGPGVVGGRVVDDMVSLIDLAPTFLEAAHIKPPESMTDRSLWPLLHSKNQVLLTRHETVYLQAVNDMLKVHGLISLPTHNVQSVLDHVLIMNFRPDRWPLGDPYHLEEGPEPTQQELETNTRLTLSDEDAGPTKAWLVQSRKKILGRCSSSRFTESDRISNSFISTQDLFSEMHNLAGQEQYAAVEELTKTLQMRCDVQVIQDLSEKASSMRHSMAGPLKKISRLEKSKKAIKL